MLLQILLVGSSVVILCVGLGVIYEFWLPRLWKTDTRIWQLVMDLNAVKSFLKIFGGELNFKVYNNPKIESAFREAKKRGVEIEMMAGPLLSVDKDNKNIVIDLAKEGIIKLYCRIERTSLSHFRIIDGKMMYLETTHTPLGKGKVIPIEDLEAAIRKYEGIFDEFIERAEAKLSMDPEKDFVVVTPAKIRQLERYCKNQGLNLDKLPINRIKEALSISTY